MTFSACTTHQAGRLGDPPVPLRQRSLLNLQTFPKKLIGLGVHSMSDQCQSPVLERVRDIQMPIGEMLSAAGKRLAEDLSGRIEIFRFLIKEMNRRGFIVHTVIRHFYRPMPQGPPQHCACFVPVRKEPV